MPGFEKCRLCGDCCIGCIFLHYDEQKDLMGCLIYNNKDRQIVTGWYLYSHYIKGNQRSLALFINELSTIFNGESTKSKYKRELCDHYQCVNMEKKGQVPFNIRKSQVFRELQLTEARIQRKYRNLIENFKELLDILCM